MIHIPVSTGNVVINFGDYENANSGNSGSGGSGTPIIDKPILGH